MLEIVEWLVVFGFFSTLIGFIIAPVAGLLHQISLAAMICLNTMVDLLSNIPTGTFYIKRPPLLIIIATYIWLILGLIKPKNVRSIHYAGLFILSCYFSITFLQNHGKIKITFLDVGQGDATLIEGPKGETILIDTGPPFYYSSQQAYGDVARNILLPVLKSKGINKLDMLVISHFDLDHYGALYNLVENITIGLVIENGHLPKDIKAVLTKHNIPTYIMNRGDILSYGDDFKLTCFHSGNPYNNLSKNDRSLVIKLSHKTLDILFTGDISETIEYELVRNYKDQLESEILKVAHHGSNTSSSSYFLDRVNPMYSIISSGVENKFNHPHPDILDRLEKKSTVLGTKRHGAIIVTHDNENMYLNTFLK